MHKQRVQHIDWSNWVIGTSLALAALSIVHLLQDAGVGLIWRLGFSVIQTVIVMGGLYVVQIIMILLAAAEQKEGYIGSLVLGIFWLFAAVADLGRMLIGWPYPAGPLMVGSGMILLLCAVAVIMCSYAAWRLPPARSRRNLKRPPHPLINGSRGTL